MGTTVDVKGIKAIATDAAIHSFEREPEAANTPGIDHHLILKGRPPLGEFLGFVSGQAIEAPGGGVDYRTLTEEWRLANDHICDLEQKEAGWANNPPIGDLPPELDTLVNEVLRDPIFSRSFPFVPCDIKIVELDRLVVFQKQINLNYVRQLRRTIGAEPTQEAIFRLCLPSDHPHPDVQYRPVAPNVYVFSSHSNDFRFLEACLFSPVQVPSYDPPGPPFAVMGLVMGFGSNYLNTIQAEGRLILGNGSHRAFALREAGVTHVPAVIQKVSRREELNVIAAPEVQNHPDVYLTSLRPPLLKDYFDPILRKIIDVRKQLRQVKVSFGVETIDVPAGN
jgi:hypothetical protein